MNTWELMGAVCCGSGNLPVDFVLGDFMEVLGRSKHPSPLSQGFMNWVEISWTSRNPGHSKYNCLCYENDSSDSISRFCITGADKR